MRTLEERFWSKADTSGGPDTCWEWQACKNDMGYGQFRTSERAHYAHRFSWTLTKGPLDSEACVLHRCDNPGCVNPAHLFLGSRTENAADRVSKNRSALGNHNGSAKLNPEAVLAIRASEESNTALASRFGVNIATVRSARRRDTWRHVP